MELSLPQKLLIQSLKKSGVSPDETIAIMLMLVKSERAQEIMILYIEDKNPTITQIERLATNLCRTLPPEEQNGDFIQY